MIRPDLAIGVLLMTLAAPPPEVQAQAAKPPELEAPSRPVVVTVKAGPFERHQTPIRFEVEADRLGPGVLEALRAGPAPIRVTTDPRGAGSVSTAQIERIPGRTKALVTFVLPVSLAKQAEHRFSFDLGAPASAGDPAWDFAGLETGALDLRLGARPVFRYNAAPVSSPNYKEIQIRDAYIHPAYSPSGALVTGDFSPSHPHHRGFFLAYERTKTGDLAPDFWNIHVGSGKIHADGLDPPVAGPIVARFSSRHRWEARDKASGKGIVVLRERWDVEGYNIPGAPYWLFDLTSTQQAVDRPLELLPYRYGGMAYRGPEPFVKGTLDVLTSEGKHRKDGDQKPARWVDLTGPVADGSEKYAGAMIADHPTNPHFVTVARIHPTTLPFFCYVPSHDRPLTIATDMPTVFRYRVLIHDGRPDPGLDERAWRDFAEPPTVVVGPDPG